MACGRGATFRWQSSAGVDYFALCFRRLIATKKQMTNTSNALRILLVEDNEHVRELTGELLAQAGREVSACGSAEEALRLFAERPFHAVITDVSLPAMSGIDLARNLLKSTPHLCVVICSGYRFEAGIDKLGPNVHVLAKPFETRQVDEILSRIAT